MFFHTYTFYWILAGICLYAVATRGLFRATNNMRLSLIDLAADLIKEPSIPDSIKTKIRLSLDDVHSVRAAWGMMLCLFMISFAPPFINPSIAGLDDLPKETQRKLDAFLNRWYLSTIANSVLATIISMTLIVIVFAFFSSIHPIARLIMGKRRAHMVGHDRGHAHA